MKVKYMNTLLILLGTMLFVWSSPVRAQIDGHNYTVQWADNNGDVVTNALYNAVAGDTASDGTRADPDRVYILLKGGVYWNTEHMQNSGYTLRLMGEDPDPNDQYGFPPILQLVTRQDGSADSKILVGSGGVYFKNIYIIGSDDKGVQSSYYQPIEFSANNLRCVFDNCIFERANFAITAWQGSKNNTIIFTNCKWYNLVERPITQQWTGRGISIWADQDTVIVENCTMDNVGFTALQIEGGAAKYLRFNHNTIINLGRGITSAPWLREAYFANNLFINPFFDGEGYADYNPVSNPSRYNYYTGFFSFSSIPSGYGTDLARRILFANNAAFLAQSFKNAWADTVRIQPFTSATTDSFFTYYSPTNADHPGQMVIKDTTWLSNLPNFTKYDTSNYPQMIQFIKDIRAGITPAPQWMQDLTVIGSDTIWTAPQWPLVQNFAYSDASLMTAGTDGLPLGDLNWFPSQKADFETNKDQYIKQIEGMAGGRISDDVVWEGQAEDGTLADGAAVVPYTGPSWYTLAAGTNIQWVFNSNYAGLFDLKMKARADGANIGFDFVLNSHTIVDAARKWGQFVVWTGADDPQTFWSGKTTNQFYEAPYASADLWSFDATPYLSVESGQDTLMLRYSWNAISFAEVDLYEAGTTNLIAQLLPSDAENHGATPNGEGKWVPEGFNSVNLGTNGSATFNVDMPSAGQYLVRVFYQNPGAAQTGSLALDGTAVSSFAFDSKADSTGEDGVSELFTVASAGTHAIKISGSGVNVDKLQLIQRTFTGTYDKDILPNKYTLSQNYPNPFNPSTTIKFGLAKSSIVNLTVYNILGQRVAQLVNGFMNAGEHSINFNAASFASGVYIYRIEAGSFKANKKMVLLK